MGALLSAQGLQGLPSRWRGSCPCICRFLGKGSFLGLALHARCQHLPQLEPAPHTIQMSQMVMPSWLLCSRFSACSLHQQLLRVDKLQAYAEWLCPVIFAQKWKRAISPVIYITDAAASSSYNSNANQPYLGTEGRVDLAWIWMG